MRILFATWAWPSHFFPLVPFAQALRAAGHEVVVASHSGFEATITDAGLPALGCGARVDLAEVLRRELGAAGWRPRRPAPQPSDGRRPGISAFRVAAASAELMSADILSFAEFWRPDAVVFEPMAFAGPLVARARDIPCARLPWAPDICADVDEVERELLGGLFAAHRVDRIGALGDLTLDPCPRSIQVVDAVPRQRFRYVPYSGPAVRPSLLDEPRARPRVCLTWGTFAHVMGFADAVGPLVVRALGALDIEVVLAVLDEQLPLFDPLPGNVIAAGRFPLQAILPYCDAVIHRGGAGTAMTAASCGVPQWAIPLLPDAVFTMRHIAATGAARWQWHEDVTATDVARVVSALLDDGAHRRAAARLADQMRALAPVSELVSTFERFATV